MAALQRYWAVWVRVTVVVLGLGAGVLAAVIAIAAPWAAVTLMVAGWVLWRIANRVAVGHHVGVARLGVEVSDPRVMALLPAFVAGGVGWHLLLGSAGTVVVLLDLLAGLPLLLVGDRTVALVIRRVVIPRLGEAELWDRWEASDRALQLATTPAARLRIVAARATYLDALAERDPAGLSRRLGLDAAAGDSDNPLDPDGPDGTSSATS